MSVQTLFWSAKTKKNLFHCITGAGKPTALIFSLFTLWLWLVHTVIPTLGDWGKKAVILRPTWCTQAIFYPQTSKQNYRKEISRSNRHKKGTRFWFSCIISKYFSRLLKYFSRFSRLWLRIKGFKVMVITLSEIRLQVRASKVISDSVEQRAPTLAFLGLGEKEKPPSPHLHL